MSGRRTLLPFTGIMIFHVGDTQSAILLTLMATVQSDLDGHAFVTAATSKTKLPMPLRHSKDSESANK